MRIEHGVNENPLFIPTGSGTQQKVKSGEKLILHYFLVDIITIKTFQIIFFI